MRPRISIQSGRTDHEVFTKTQIVNREPVRSSSEFLFDQATSGPQAYRQPKAFVFFFKQIFARYSIWIHFLTASRSEVRLY